MTAPAALLFDFGGTLDSDGVSWKERFRRIWSEEAGPVEPARFDRAFYDADDALVGNLPPDLSLAATVERLAGGLAQRLGGEETAARRVGSRFTQEAFWALAQSASLLASLAPRYRLGVVSNFYGNLVAVCREAGLAPYLAAAVDSAVVGAAKPDPRIFEEALRQIAAAPEDTCVIGDSPARDMTGARRMGMRHVLLSGSDPSASAELCCAGDSVIRRLADLPEVLV